MYVYFPFTLNINQLDNFYKDQIVKLLMNLSILRLSFTYSLNQKNIPI